MPYTFDPIFAVDPGNPANVAANAVVTIFAPGDTSLTPLVLTTPDGLPFENPLTTSPSGHEGAFVHETLGRVAWSGGGFTGFFTAHDSIKQEAVAARDAAQLAAENATAELSARIAAGEFQGEPGRDGSNVVPTAQAIATEISTDGTPANTALNATFVPFGIGAGLDIWGEYALRGSYANVIEQADSALGVAATKTTIGTASDSATPIYAYTAGREGAPHALLISGTHGHEVLPVGACHRWMEAFATSEHPAMRELRKRLRVTWVPALNATQYRGTRQNSNGVDLNRNFDLNWALYTPPSTTYAKGTSAFSEPETAAIKQLIDTTDIAFMLDAHHHGNEIGLGNVAIGSPPAWAGGDWRVTESARRIVTTEYADGYTVSGYPVPNPWPLSHAWAAKYLRWNKDLQNSGACLIEVSHDLAGSTPWQLTADAARLYCGAITSVFIEWLNIGQAPASPVWADLSVARTDNDATNNTLALGSGGRLVTSENPTPITFDSGRNYVAVPIVGPGTYTVHYEITMMENGAAGTVQGLAGIGLMPASGNVAVSLKSLSYLTLATGAFGQAVGSASYVVDEVPADNILMAQVFAAKVTATPNVRLVGHGGMRATVTYSPKDGYTYPSGDIVRS